MLRLVNHYESIATDTAKTSSPVLRDLAIVLSVMLRLLGECSRDAKSSLNDKNYVTFAIE